MENTNTCNFLVSPLVEASDIEPMFVRNKKKIKNILSTIYARVKYNFLRIATQKSNDSSKNDYLPLQPGEWVEVRSMREIALTLDKRIRHKGLYFMPEMEQFCGRKFRIYKKAEIIKLESTGELRKLKSPTLFLEGVHCDGAYQGGCDRACFHFWREAWLKRITD
jgi:hypothetical protein